jgi:hypothetical protein
VPRWLGLAKAMSQRTFRTGAKGLKLLISPAGGRGSNPLPSPHAFECSVNLPRCCVAELPDAVEQRAVRASGPRAELSVAGNRRKTFADCAPTRKESLEVGYCWWGKHFEGAVALGPARRGLGRPRPDRPSPAGRDRPQLRSRILAAGFPDSRAPGPGRSARHTCTAI